MCSKCKLRPCAPDSAWCNVCRAAYQRARRKDPETAAKMKVWSTTTWLRRKFGIEQSEYDAMLAQQGGVCALCGAPPGRYRHAVDHDHVTGRIRGLLCMGCNRSLGWVERVNLEAVAAYLHD